jgi:hypothetical protein
LTKEKGKKAMINTIANTFGKKKHDKEQRMIGIGELDLIPLQHNVHH